MKLVDSLLALIPPVAEPLEIHTFGDAHLPPDIKHPESEILRAVPSSTP